MYVTIHRTQNVKVHYQQLVLSTLYEPAGQSPAGQVCGVHRHSVGNSLTLYAQACRYHTRWHRRHEH